MFFITREKWNWHNIIKACQKVSKWKYKDGFLRQTQSTNQINPYLQHSFKELFWCAVLNWPAPSGGEEIKNEIRSTIKRYRPDESEWWYPEIAEHFYPRYLASKGGVFFTPQKYCELLSELALLYIKKKPSNVKNNPAHWNKDYALRVYDPACGIGALLFTFQKYQPNCEIYGQEIEHESVLLARWILLNQGSRYLGGGEMKPLANLPKKVGKIKCEDTLKKMGFKKNFHVVLCNPPFNQLLEQKAWGTKDGNTAWTRQCLNKLKKEGVCLIILPTSILVTKQYANERKRLVKNNLLEAAFFDFLCRDTKTGQSFDNAQLDTCVILLRKKREEQENVFFVNCAGKTKGQIMEEYAKRGEKVSRENLKKHDYCFIKYILERFNEPKGEEIGNYFTKVNSRGLKESDKKDIAIKLATKLFEKNREPISQIVNKMESTGGGVEHWYLINKKKNLTPVEKKANERRINQLHYYLTKNEPTMRKFYYGSVIKELRIKEFLEWKVLWEEPVAEN